MEELVACIKLLPECAFHSDEHGLPISVKLFQSNLSCLLKLASNHLDEWDNLFCPRSTIHNHLLRRFSVVSDLDAYR